MKKLNVWLTASAAAAAVAVAAATMAGQANAQLAIAAGKPAYPNKHVKFMYPKLKNGVLSITGTQASEKVALRLKAGDPGTLEIDLRDNGSADFSFARGGIARIALDARAGNDVVRIDESNGAFTDSIPTQLAGGSGSDTIAGGKGIETLLGGAGNDSIDGNVGNDVAQLGAGNDTFVWDPGDGSDIVEGQAGTDTMVFNGANIAEQVEVSANGSRLKFFRNPGNVTMDTGGVERVDFNALGGADVVTVNDLSGTGVSRLNIDLAGTLGGVAGDGQGDRVIVNGTDRNDAIDVSGDASIVKVIGLAATVAILHSEAANDRLELNTLAGTDTVASRGLAAGSIHFLVDGVLVL